MQKFWNIKSVFTDSDDVVKTILSNRGVSDINEYLTPPPILDLLKKLPADFKNSLVHAKKIIDDAILTEVPIVIHGDYDADGVCATTILYQTIKNELKYKNVHYFIPDRFKHGYGLSVDSVNDCIKLAQGDKTGQKILIITVDSGITSLAEVKYIKDSSHSVIITDHHQKPESDPQADCIVWNDQIVGSTISWLLSRVLGSKDNKSIVYAGIATITDLQQLLSLNRAVVKRGIEILNINPPIGLKKLMDLASLTGKEITTYDIGWVIGPRLNASGRIIHASDAVSLLLSQSAGESFELAQKLNETNIQRQDITNQMYEKINVELGEGSATPKILFAMDKDFHEGIIGLIASKLVQKYYRPAVVMSILDDHVKGSVRSIPGFNITEFLRKLDKDLFDSLGGHPMAGGFTIKKEKINEFIEKANLLIETELDTKLLTPVLDVDMEIPIQNVNLSLLAQIEKMKPFGLGNEEPVFVSRKVGVMGVNTFGKENQHSSIRLYDAGNSYKATYFNSGEKFNSLAPGETVDIAYNIRKNIFNQKTYLDIVIKDLKTN